MAALSIWEHSGRTLPPNLYWMIAIVSLFIACFKAWKDERKDKEAAISQLASNQSEVKQQKVGWQELYNEKKRLEDEIDKEIKRLDGLHPTFETNDTSVQPEDRHYYLSVSDPEEYYRIWQKINRIKEDIEIIKEKMKSMS